MKFKKQIPNMLSVFRLILIGVFIALFKNERYLWSFFVYIFAFGTDILDGWLARRNNWITNVGKVLDPLADKLMLIAVLACFWFKGVIPLYIMLIILAKDAIMIIVGGILYSKHVVVYGRLVRKDCNGAVCRRNNAHIFCSLNSAYVRFIFMLFCSHSGSVDLFLPLRDKYLYKKQKEKIIAERHRIPVCGISMEQGFSLEVLK